MTNLTINTTRPIGWEKIFIYVYFDDNTIWKIPATFIAEKRAYYYACEVDGFGKDSPEYLKEVEYSMEPDELHDWASNHLDWEDVKDVAIFIEKSEIKSSYSEEWTNAQRDYIEE